MTEKPSEGARKRDRFLGGVAATIFSVTLGLNSVAVPLLAIHAGYSVAEIGLLTAVPAIAQIAARLTMGAMMRKLPDKVFIIASAIFMSLACALVALSPFLIFFLLSQLLQGVARAYFYTGSQTHAVRISHSAVGALTYLGLAGGVGSLIGPVLAGVISEQSIEGALWFAAAFGALGIVPSALLIRLPVFAAVSSIEGRVPGRIWRRPGVSTAASMTTTAGAWRGMLNSYVPVVLAQAGQTAAVIGALISVTNGAALLGSALSTMARSAGIRFSLVFGVIAAGVGLAAVGLLAEFVLLTGAVLAFSGIGAGILQTVGPALASESVHPDEKGEAIASTGTFRASALFVAPAGTAGLVLIMPIGIALFAVGLLIAVPALFGGRAPNSREVD